MEPGGVDWMSAQVFSSEVGGALSLLGPLSSDSHPCLRSSFPTISAARKWDVSGGRDFLSLAVQKPRLVGCQCFV